MDATQRFVERLHYVLAKNHARREFDLVEMAAAMRLSSRQLQRKVKQLFGCGPAQYLRVYRLRRALAHLLNDSSVGEVADTVGFSSHAYFTFCFKAEFGTTPSDFQARFRNGQHLVSDAR